MQYGVIYSWTFQCLTYKNKTYKMSRNLTNICTLEACQSIRSAAEKKGESFILHILNSIYGDLIVAEGKYHGNMELNGELPQSSETHCVARTTLTLNLHFCTRVIFVPFHQVHAVFCL